MIQQAEYLWLDGEQPTQQLRSKTRMLDLPAADRRDLSCFPHWSYDGSSTFQADGSDSDLTLRPVAFVADPLRGAGNHLVLCEVFEADGRPHWSNSRAGLREALDQGAAADEPWVGFEQEYTLFRDGRPLGFPEDGVPAPQGPYYCAVGHDRIFGRDFVEAHAAACLDAGLMIYGVNAEVMPGQWEFQIGYRGVAGESAGPLTVSDHLMVARWLLHRLGERFGVEISLDPKPARGDWNGAGAHTNFSTRTMRRPETGLAAIRRAVDDLESRHQAHIAVYGDGLEERLTGRHETSTIDRFLVGVADRGASVRVPRHVQEKGHGYLEDRRPGANCDPYQVCSILLETVCLGGEAEGPIEAVA